MKGEINCSLKTEHYFLLLCCLGLQKDGRSMLRSRELLWEVDSSVHASPYPTVAKGLTMEDDTDKAIKDELGNGDKTKTIEVLERVHTNLVTITDFLIPIHSI